MTVHVKFGIVTPVVVAVPHYHAQWETTAGVRELVAVARAADRLGFHHLTCSDHVAVPAEVAPARGSRYWDPWTTLGFLAGHTNDIRLATHVLVLGYHHPLEIIKRAGTLSELSQGRVILGVGVGSLREEFDLLGAEFPERGARADDAIQALRRSWGTRCPEYDGDHFRFRGFVVDPVGTDPPPPLWVGGRTMRSLMRAVKLGDGWVPFGLRKSEIRELLVRARDSAEWAARSRDLELVYESGRLLDPIGDPEGVAAEVQAYRDLGATHMNLRFAHESVTHYLEQLSAMAALPTD